MKKMLVLASIIVTLFAFKKGTDENRAAAIESAINKSLPLLQSSSHTFLKSAAVMINCHSCHNQGLGLITFAMAKQKGFSINDTIFNEAIDSSYKQWKTADKVLALMENDDPSAIIITGNYDLWAFKENDIREDKLIDLLSRNLMNRQSYDGSWFSPGQRPPLEYYSFSVTALTVKNIQAYRPDILKDEVKLRVEKAQHWMKTSVPITHEEKIFQLLGLTWSNADTAFIMQQAKKLLSLQQADGGWSQLTTLTTDAYATGQALYALNKCGALQTTDPAYQKGVDFLLHTQEPDGSWHIKTRSFPFVPFVDSGFPHKSDQFISAAGSNWATMALLLASK